MQNVCFTTPSCIFNILLVFKQKWTYLQVKYITSAESFYLLPISIKIIMILAPAWAKFRATNVNVICESTSCIYYSIYIRLNKALKVSATAAHGSAASRILPHNRQRSLAPARAWVEFFTITTLSCSSCDSDVDVV